MFFPTKITPFFFLLAIVVCRAVHESEKRVKEKPLSDKDHYDEHEAHNSEFDHEAFLGEEYKDFNDLSPEESKERLGKIVDKIDKDKDGLVTEAELKDWITYTQKKYILDDVEKQWKVIHDDKTDVDHLDWKTYKESTYSNLNEETDEDDDFKSYRQMMDRDKRRFDKADKDGDGKLTKAEFGDFLHPEEVPHLHDIVILETIEDIDKDGDGKISLAEYIGDMYSGSDEDEPDWVKTEREQFNDYRDLNKDGFMDKEEVREWILPSDYDNSGSEAKHLIGEADENKDLKLSKEEILSNYDLFVGSQATDFGNALTRHDEF